MNPRGRSEPAAPPRALGASASSPPGAEPRPEPHPLWPGVAATLMWLGLLLLLAGWFMPSLWRPGWAQWRPWAWLMVAAGALIQWLLARHRDERRRRLALATLTHNSLTPYDFAPVTLPMEEPAVEVPLASHPSPSPALTAFPAHDTATTPASPVAPLMAAVLASTPKPKRPAAGAARPPLPTSPSAAPVPVAPKPVAAPAPTAPSAPLWSAGLLRGLQWQRFEALCDLVLQQDGYVTRIEPPGSRTGVDIRLYSRLDLQHPVRIVACRPWHDEPVPAAALREFLGALVDAGVASGAFMTAGRFDAESQAFARRHGITLVDGPELLALMARRAPELQQALVRAATEGEPGRPTCRQCGAKMAAHTSPDGEPGHWRCTHAPHCNGRLQWLPGPA